MVVGVSLQGETFHRNNPSPLTDQLYLSAARAISGRVLLDLGITCIINATLELPTMAYHMQDALQIAVEDRVASKLYVYFDLVADKIDSVHKSDGKIMIYCRAGMSRSASLCIAYFIKYHGMSVEEAYNYVRARRPIIHPNVGFMRQLKDFERRLRTAATAKHHHSSNISLNLSSQLSFASECNEVDHDLVDYDTGTKVLKPSLPRRPKVLFSEMLDLAAETYQISVVQICHVNEPNNNNNNNSSSGAEATAAGSSSAALERAEVGVAMPDARHAPAQRSPTPLETSESCPSSPSAPSSEKTPFTKISEPAKIAPLHFLKSLKKSIMNVSAMFPKL